MTKLWLNEGYLMVNAPQHPNACKKGTMYLHRYLMSLRLGRALDDNEMVHHINGNKLDNDTGNLLLVQGRKGHQVAHNPEYADPEYVKEQRRKSKRKWNAKHPDYYREYRRKRRLKK